MKKNVLLFLLITSTIACSQKTKQYVDAIKQFQYTLNTEFANAETSPLTEEDLKNFKALEFFPINEAYNIKASFELTPNTQIFEMPTTTERLPLYRKYGIVRFELQGEEIELSIYQNQQLMQTVEYKNYLFLPFTDTTNGSTSYGGGRYIDLEIPEEESTTIYIDFNKAYNPYCAYNSKFSCPIPPSENRIKTEINAGVKAFGNHN